ncbi:MAG: CpsB/CapC family capsule biosynthesis tyrosine phosphatase [Planctomycetota bacterium]
MWLWPKKKAAATTAPAAQVTEVVDLHCHLLPGVDDGARDLETAVQLCRMAVADGVTVAVCTPHTLDGVYDVARSRAREALQELRAELARQAIDLELRLAAEVRYDEAIADLLAEWPCVSLDGERRYLLLELPHQGVPAELPGLLFRLRAAGTTPVIAHPERNLGVRDDPDVTAEWVRLGAKLQVTAGSVSGAFGPVIGACAEQLLRAGRIHVMATDTHSPGKRPPLVQGAAGAAATIVGEAGARTLLVDNPRRILAGAPANQVTAVQPIVTNKRSRRRARVPQ